MYAYNPKSLKAEEFINHQEILDTLAYAEASNKDNLKLIDQIIEKAKLCKGLTHREASRSSRLRKSEKDRGALRTRRGAEKEILRQPHRHVCPALPLQLPASTVVSTALTTARTAISRARS